MKLSIGTLIKYKRWDGRTVAIGVITRFNERDGRFTGMPSYTIHWTDRPDWWQSNISHVLAKVIENNNQPHHFHQYYILTRGIS